MTTTTTSIKRVIGRRPDYHIGPNGIPRLTGLRMRKMNSPQQQPLQQPTDPVKLNKCLYNLTVRNGTNAAVRSDKIESDIAIRNQYSSKSSSSNCSISDRRSSSTTIASSANRNDPRNTSQQSNYSSSIPRISTSISSSTNNNSRNSNGIVMNGSRPLLSGRQQRHQRSATAAGDDAGSNGDGADANLINGSANGDRRRSSSSVLVRQYRLSAAIDNRLSYQRKYDRTIFGCNRLDQFVLPPLQI
ncbi:uncharacterized protein LOC120423986 [Culex pipiens pallens]|uniref:uncharacterized protein LOC120423986 n=1 Tax=Culex pipiens pallens TaxID=42434 RepID=UPI0019546345|nr:uncharacterized protein LOC120423986 [Culex pipiens pallens]